MLTIEQLAELVEKMRASQKLYFHTRDPRNLSEAKQRERAVDRAVAEILRPPKPNPQGELF